MNNTTKIATTTSYSASAAARGVVAAGNGVPAAPVVLSFDKSAADPRNPGAQVHEEGQLVDAETRQFQGSIRLMPATTTPPSWR